jgi:hypothetical protein
VQESFYRSNVLISAYVAALHVNMRSQAVLAPAQYQKSPQAVRPILLSQKPEYADFMAQEFENCCEEAYKR